MERDTVSIPFFLHDFLIENKNDLEYVIIL